MIERSEVEAIFFTEKNEEKLRKIVLSGTGKLKHLISMDLKENKDGIYSEKELIGIGKKIIKDPTVTNLQSSTNDCYAYLQISIPRKEIRLYEFLDDGTSRFANNGNPLITDLFTYTLNNGWVLIESSQSENESVYLYGYETPIKPGESTVPLFNEIQYVNVIEGDIPISTELSIPIVMITIQSDYLKDANNIYDAWEVYKEVKK